MLHDNTELLAQVNADIQKVRDALAAGLATVPDTDAAASLNGLPIEAWAQRGLTAASAVVPTDPSANGWPGWTNAGHVFLQGIEDLVHLGSTDTLDEITATIKDIPEETVKATKKAIKHVAKTASDAADSAMHAASAVGGFFSSLTTKIVICGVSFAALMIVTSRR